MQLRSTARFLLSFPLFSFISFQVLLFSSPHFYLFSPRFLALSSHVFTLLLPLLHFYFLILQPKSRKASDEKNIVRLPRQHLQKSDGRVCDEEVGR